MKRIRKPKIAAARSERMAIRIAAARSRLAAMGKNEKDADIETIIKALDGRSKEDEFNEIVVLYRRDFDGGDRTALLYVMVECINHGCTVPEWAGVEFKKLISQVERGEFKGKNGAPSYDAAFGKPWRPKEDSLFRFAESVYEACMERKEKGEPLSDATFEAVGRELGIGGATTIKRLYSGWKEGLEVKATYKKLYEEQGPLVAMAYLYS
jgi:hypothetical protein